MLIPTKDIPQADDLTRVVSTTEAVGRGARTDKEIAKRIGDYDPRQGRYYRRAAEILGLVQNIPHENRSVLTRAGVRFFRSSGDERTHLLAQAVLSSRLAQRFIPFLESRGSQGATRTELESFMGTVTATTAGMVRRRLTTIMTWLKYIGLVAEVNGKYVLKGLPGGVSQVEFSSPEEPLLPHSFQLSEYRSLAKQMRHASQTLSLVVNQAARERGDESHRMLVDLVASKIRAAGAIPRSNAFIDLAAKVSSQSYIFEMKSTTKSNAHSQVRSAISQLYEYRYIHKLPTAKLVVVIEHPPSRELEWIVDYVVKDRELLIAWDGDRKTVHCPAALTHQLSFLL